MRIVLIYPDKIETHDPKGIIYIGTALKNAGYDIKIIGIRLRHQVRDEKGVLSFHVEPGATEKLSQDLKKLKPDIVGVSLLTPDAERAKVIAKTVKEYDPKIPVIFGGVHPTIMPEEVLKDKNVDFVVIGEGEITAVELVKTIEKKGDIRKVKGIGFRENNKIIKTEPRPYIEDMDTLPIPDRELLPIKRILKVRPFFPLPYPYLDIIGCRGCFFNCAFCQPTLKKVFGLMVRKRSPENMIKELKFLKAKYGIRGIVFSDDTLISDKKWTMRLCDLMIQEKLKIKWFCNARINLMDREVMKKMKEAGCIGFVLAIESGNNRVRNKILNKGVSKEQIYNAFRLSKELGFVTQANIMIGSPTETEEELNESVELIKQIDPDEMNTSFTTILPHTYLWYKHSDLLDIYNWELYNLDVPKQILSNIPVEKKIKVRTFLMKNYGRFGKSGRKKFFKYGWYRKMVLYRWYTMLGRPSMLISDILAFFNIISFQTMINVTTKFKKIIGRA